MYFKLSFINRLKKILRSFKQSLIHMDEFEKEFIATFNQILQALSESNVLLLRSLERSFRLMNYALVPIYSIYLSETFLQILTSKEFSRIYKTLLISNIIILFASFGIARYTGFISKITDFGTLFSVTLTFILVYATFSLLAFTYVLVLNNENSNDNLKSINVKKSGELFLLSTCLALIGFALIYSFLFYTKLFNNITILTGFVQYIFILTYFLIDLVILIYSIIYFFVGFYLILKSIRNNLMF